MEKRYRVLFIYHGGTPGMILRRSGNRPAILVPPDNDRSFRAVCGPILQSFEDLEISFTFVTAKDSTDVDPNDWTKLICLMQRAQEERFDAVVVVHGTDTLSYSAAAVALGMGGALFVPGIFSGSQTPIYQVGGDGRSNLENLFRTARAAIENRVTDVLITFGPRILLGCRSVKVSERKFDAFRSPAYPDVGFIDANGVHLHPDLVRRKHRFISGRLRSLWHQSPRSKITFLGKVLGIQVSPGMEPELLDVIAQAKSTRAVILYALGEGNIPTNLLPVIREATKRGVPMFIASQFPGGVANSQHYEVGEAAVDAGGIPCFDHTTPAIEVKVRWLLGNGISDIADFKKAMATSFVGEVTTPRRSKFW